MELKTCSAKTSVIQQKACYTSEPSMETQALNDKLWDVTFSAVVKSISSKEAHYGSGLIKAHRNATKSKCNVNGTWKKGAWVK